jgi:hypothetical protein
MMRQALWDILLHTTAEASRTLPVPRPSAKALCLFLVSQQSRLPFSPSVPLVTRYAQVYCLAVSPENSCSLEMGKMSPQLAVLDEAL